VSLCRIALVSALITLVVVPSAQGATRRLAPGESFEQAYNSSQSGDVIQVPAGTYGAQIVPDGTKAITFQGLPGNKIRKLDNYSANTTFDRLDIDAAFGTPNGAAFESHGVANVTLKNSRVGNVIDQKGALLGGWGSTSSMHVVIDNVYFHDVYQRGADVHNECIFSQVPGLTIRNSRFRNCATMDLMVTRGDFWGQPTYGGLTLENNVFAHSVNGEDPDWHYYGFLLHGNMGQLTNVRIVNNTFESPVGGITTQDVHSASGVWANNIGGGWDCLPGITYRGNVGKKCAAPDIAVDPASSCAPPACTGRIIAPVGWVNSVGFDFHLRSSSPAVGAADPAYAPARDRDGKLRDGNPDSGAYEYGVGGSPGSSGGGPTAWRLNRARLAKRTICRKPHKGCPRSTKLRLVLGRPATVAVRLDRLRKGKAAKRARVLRARKLGLHKAIRIKARGLKPGRYRLTVLAVDASKLRAKPVRLRLRVR
jgi:hypothetical protein